MLPIAITKQVVGFLCITAALVDEVLACVALAQNLFQFLRDCDWTVKRNMVQAHIRDIDHHIPRVELVGLEYLAVLSGAKCQKFIERMALLEL